MFGQVQAPDGSTQQLQHCVAFTRLPRVRIPRRATGFVRRRKRFLPVAHLGIGDCGDVDVDSRRGKRKQQRHIHGTAQRELRFFCGCDRLRRGNADLRSADAGSASLLNHACGAHCCFRKIAAIIGHSGQRHNRTYMAIEWARIADLWRRLYGIFSDRGRRWSSGHSCAGRNYGANFALGYRLFSRNRKSRGGLH